MYGQREDESRTQDGEEDEEEEAEKEWKKLTEIKMLNATFFPTGLGGLDP